MRLTLRTMLAYLDHVLNPDEAEDLGKKIEQSEFAGDLIQRIRTVTKKVRMNAPKLDGKGMGSDANTVSEYLDSALPLDRVSDFERICLDSEMHLAEVAGCHQILTLVLGTPAEVPESLRDRVYALGQADQAPAANTESKKAGRSAQAGANGHAATAMHSAQEVPDYLRGGQRSGVWQLIAAVAAAFLITALVLRMMGPFSSAHPILKLFGGGTPVVDMTGNNTVTPPAAAPSTLSAKSPETTGAVSDERGTASGTPAGVPSSESPATVAADAGNAATPAERGPMPKPIVMPEVPDVADASATPAAPAPAVAAAPAAKPLPAGPVPPMPPAPAPPAAALDVGRYISDEQVLAQQMKDDGNWHRIPPRAVLTAGDRLVALPAFRPQIALASGVQVTFAGDSSVQLQAPGEGGASRISVSHGRLLIVTVGAAGAQIDLVLPGVRGVATLVDADSAMAVSVKQFLPPGADPAAVAPVPVIEIFNTHGRVTWREDGKESVDIPTGQVRIYAGADPAETYGPFAPPDWIDARSISGIDRESATVLQRLLETDKPLNLSLAETMEHRQVNVRSLAARCLSVLDEFEPLIKELSDARQYSFWPGEFHSLRQAIQRGPESAAKLKATIERLRPDQAADLYRLLWSYSADQLAKDGAATLVKSLESEHMDIRVLAFQNLVAITGAMEFYLPQKRPEDVRAAIMNWKARLAKGTISYKSPPSAIEPYKPLDRPPAGAIDLTAPKGAVAPLAPPATK